MRTTRESSKRVAWIPITSILEFLYCSSDFYRKRRGYGYVIIKMVQVFETANDILYFILLEIVFSSSPSHRYKGNVRFPSIVLAMQMLFRWNDNNFKLIKKNGVPWHEFSMYFIREIICGMLQVLQKLIFAKLIWSRSIEQKSRNGVPLRHVDTGARRKRSENGQTRSMVGAKRNGVGKKYNENQGLFR